MEKEAVIFDIGAVLSLPDKKKKGFHDSITKLLKISLDQWIDSIDTAYADSITGKISEKKAVQKIASNLQISEKKLKNLVVKAYKDNYKQNTELYNFAFKLKKQGYKIAILSDQWWISKRALAPKKLMDKFDEVVMSCDVGMRKPNKEIFEFTLKKLKLQPEKCLFIDNQKWNTDAAKKFGIDSILYKNNKQLFKHLTKYKILLNG